jgi:hypothetical protein
MKVFSKKRLLLGALLGLSLTSNANAGIIHDFDISINFTGGLTNSQQVIFSDAENFWESVIIGYDDEIQGPGLAIDAGAIYIDGVNGTLGQASPNSGMFLPGRVYASTGTMRFDTADMANMESNGSLFDVILHEMAHVIGFGTLWGSGFNDLLDVSGNYIGENALSAYRIESGDLNAAYVPVEMGGGEGTAGGHWDENDGGGDSELMSGWLDIGGTTFSLTTANSFADLGYIINSDYLISSFNAPVDVPEPTTLAIFGLGLLGLMAKRKKS